jgi:DNA-binding beta-propeller fold protein YncE
MRRLLLIVALSGCAAMLVSCAPAVPVPKTAEQAPLVWPSEPDPPRIAYVRTFTQPADLGIARGFFQRIADVLFGGSESRLVRPMAVVASDGVIYVADPGAKGVHRFDQAKGDYDLLRAADGAVLTSPVAMALGTAGEVYVTDSALAAVFVIARGAKAAVRLPLSAVLTQPTGIAVDRKTGRLYVVDTAAHRVNVFTRDGALVESFGQRGAGDGEFNFPTLIWRTPAGKIYVTDSLNFRIQIFDERGRYLAKFGKLGDGAGDQMRQKGVATDRQGHVYVVDALFNAMQVFDDSGRLLISVGSLGHERGDFWLPVGIFIAEDDTIYVADSYNQRVQVFRYIGGAG